MEDDNKTRRWLDRYLEEHDISWPHIVSGAAWGGGISAPYEIRALPLNIIIDKEGNVAAVDKRGNKLDETIERIIASKAE